MIKTTGTTVRLAAVFDDTEVIVQPANLGRQILNVFAFYPLNLLIVVWKNRSALFDFSDRENSNTVDP